MIAPGYLRTFALTVIILFGLFLCLTWIVDPYGVSPLQISMPRANVAKPKRLDIDRLTKPYGVWRLQPRTVFLGSSRTHQSIDPASLDGTRLAPAYNAGIPGSSVSDNAAHLEQFFEVDQNLRAVFVELFLYNFIYPQPPSPKKTAQAILLDSVPLFLSASSAWDSGMTLFFNAFGRPKAYVAPGGYWVPPANFTTHFKQQPWIDFFIHFHNNSPPMSLEPSAFAALDRILELCRRHGAELHFMIGPSYPWDDYRLLSLGYWPLLEDWIRRLSAYPNVFSFSQYNEVLAEPAAEKMRYWNDPLHFNVNLGRLMLRSFLDESSPEIPSTLLRRVNPETIETVLKERRAGLDRWAIQNPSYPAAFDQTKAATSRDRKWGP